MEGSQDREGRGVSRPCAYAGGDSTKTVGIKFHGILEGKEQYDAVRTVWGTEIQYRSREFWRRGYYVDTAGKNASRIAEYIANQLKEDDLGEQLTMSEIGPFTGGK